MLQNNMAAKKLLKFKRLKIFWNSRVSYLVNLMLQEIGTLLKFNSVISMKCMAIIFSKYSLNCDSEVKIRD